MRDCCILYFIIIVLVTKQKSLPKDHVFKNKALHYEKKHEKQIPLWDICNREESMIY